MWVAPLGPRKCRLPRVVRRHDGAVGQVKGDSGLLAESLFLLEEARGRHESQH